VAPKRSAIFTDWDREIPDGRAGVPHARDGAVELLDDAPECGGHILHMGAEVVWELFLICSIRPEGSEAPAASCWTLAATSFCLRLRPCGDGGLSMLSPFERE
jgi:hypothetical protein